MINLQEIADDLKYYVYCLVNPIDNNIFYIGKGKGNRVQNHVQNVKENKSNAKEPKNQTIQNILDKGKEPIEIILSYGLTEEVAFATENALINLGHFFNANNLNNFNLTNLVDGHRNQLEKDTVTKFGTVKEIYDDLRLIPLDANLIKQNDGEILITSLTRSNSLTNEIMHDRNNNLLKSRSILGYTVSQKRMENIKYIISIDKLTGRIVQAFKINPENIVFEKQLKTKYAKTRIKEIKDPIQVECINDVDLFKLPTKLVNYAYFDENGINNRLQTPITYV